MERDSHELVGEGVEIGLGDMRMVGFVDPPFKLYRELVHAFPGRRHGATVPVRHHVADHPREPTRRRLETLALVDRIDVADLVPALPEQADRPMVLTPLPAADL